MNNTKEYLEDLYSAFPELEKPHLAFPSDKMLQPILITESTSVFEQNFEIAPKEINSKLSTAYLYSVYIYLILSFIENLYKPLLPDMCVGLLLFSSLQINLPRNLKSFSIKCAIGLLALIFLDVVWLVWHQSHWWRNDFGTLSFFEVFKKIQIFISYLLILTRMFIVYFIQQTYKQTDAGDNEFQYLEE